MEDGHFPVRYVGLPEGNLWNGMIFHGQRRQRFQGQVWFRPQWLEVDRKGQGSQQQELYNANQCYTMLYNAIYNIFITKGLIIVNTYMIF